MAEIRGARVASRAVCVDDRDAVGRVGDAVGGRVSGDVGRRRAIATDCACRCGLVCVAAACASVVGLSVLRDVSRALRRRALSRVDSAGWGAEGDGGEVRALMAYGLFARLGSWHVITLAFQSGRNVM